MNVDASGRVHGIGGGALTGSRPMVARLMLGALLRRLREAQGLTRERAGRQIHSSGSKIGRMELGRTAFKARDVADLLTLYGVRDETDRTTLLELAEHANTPGWWQEYGDVLPTWFEAYVGLEQAASVIRSFEVQFVPGLLQTPDYARAVIGLGPRPVHGAELDRRVELRLRRQELLWGARPPTVWAVIDEAALRRPLGGAAVMRAQFAHLLSLSRLPHVTIQVLPFAAGGHAALSGAFTLLRMPEPALDDVVYLEQLNSACYPHRPSDISDYRHVMNCLAMQAAPPRTSVEILERLVDGP